MKDHLWTAIVVVAIVLGIGYLVYETAKEKTSEDMSDQMSIITDGTYHEETVGFTLAVPEDAELINDETTRKMHENGQKYMRRKSLSAKTAHERGYNSETLFRIQIQPTKQGETQLMPGIAAWLETGPEGTTTPIHPAKYLANLDRTLHEADSQKSVPKPIMRHKLDGLDVFFQGGGIVSLASDGTKLEGTQQQYVTMVGENQYLGFALSFNDNEEARRLHKILFSLKFDTPKVNTSVIKTRIYSESTIGFAMTIPTYITIDDDEKHKEKQNKNLALVQSKSKTARTVVTKDYKRTALFRMHFPAIEQGKPQVTPSLTAWSEQPPEGTEPIKATTYLANLRKISLETGVMANYYEKTFNDTIDGVKFYYQMGLIRVGGPDRKIIQGCMQQQYAAVVKGQLLVITLNHNIASDKEAKVLMDLLFSIRFD